MASSLPLSYDYSVVLKNGAHLLLPSIHPRHLSPAERRCDSCSTIWGEKPNDEDYIEYPFVMIPCQHIVGSACLGLGLKEDKPACPVCHTRIQVGKQTEVPLHQINITDDSSPSIADGIRSEAESDTEGLSLADDESSDFDPAQYDAASMPSVAAGADSSTIQTSPVLPDSHGPADNIFSISSPPINGPAGICADDKGNSEATTTTSNINPAPTPSIQITPPSRSQTEETEIATSLSAPSEPTVPTRTLTRLDAEWYNNVIPPKAKPANHIRCRARFRITFGLWPLSKVP